MSQKHEYFGKYILLERLAAGGMAEVWLARAPGAGGIGKFVAIKKILAQYSDNPEFIQMFRDEAAIAMHLSHSNIVSIYEFGQEAHQLFLVLDYVEGRNLRQILNKMKVSQQRFSIDQICYVIKEVAAGLDHAHRCLDSSTGKPLNITHRDMSPQNVMISFEGEVRIIDFGIAKAANQMENTKTGTLKGKFGYMSPEQAEGQSTDLRTDIFSLGIALWELLANDRLFIANNEINTLRKIRECQVPSLSKMNPNINPELERIVMKALTRDRNLRYQTAAAFHRDLNRFLNRQYPDFTPHDFAVFIKTLYADEILDTRKRLIEYSKIPFQNQIGKQSFEDNDKTVVTSFEQRETIAEKTESIEDTSDGWLTNGAPTTDSRPKVFEENNTRRDFSDEDITVSATKTFSDEEFETTNGKDSSKPRILDIKSMQASLERLKNANEATYTNATKKARDKAKERGREKDTVEMAEVTANKKASRIRRPKKPTKKKESPALLRFMISVGAGVLMYFGAYNMYPEDVKRIEAQANRFLQVIMNSPRTQVPSEPTMDTDVASTNSNEAQNDNSPATVTKNLIIQSVPSGAEIFVDGKSVGDSTPARVALPIDKKVEIVLKKNRFVDYVLSSFDAANYEQGSITGTLQKALIGYIDIDVKPSRNALIYVNGEKLEERNLPIYKYAVPAKTPIEIKAINKITQEIVKEKITIYEDQRKSVILNFKKNRTPSNYE